MKPLIRAVVAAFVLVLAGCSGEQAPPQPVEQEPASTHGTLAQCLEAHGMTESSGPAAVLGPPTGVDPAAWAEAMKACSTLAPGPAGP